MPGRQLGQPVDVGLAGPEVAPLQGVAEQPVDAVAVVLVVLGGVDAALGGHAVRPPGRVVKAQAGHGVAQLARPAAAEAPARPAPTTTTRCRRRRAGPTRASSSRRRCQPLASGPAGTRASRVGRGGVPGRGGGGGPRSSRAVIAAPPPGRQGDAGEGRATAVADQRRQPPARGASPAAAQPQAAPRRPQAVKEVQPQQAAGRQVDGGHRRRAQAGRCVVVHPAGHEPGVNRPDRQVQEVVDDERRQQRPADAHAARGEGRRPGAGQRR